MDFNYDTKLYDKCNKNYFYYYPNMCYRPDIIMSEIPVSTGNGYIRLYVFTDQGRVPIEDAVVTIYARQGEVNEVPVKRILTESKPITIELPVADPAGTLIKGPEYYFTTYNMTIEKEGFYSISVQNIRMFPGVTTEFNYNLNRILPGLPGRQETIAIPPHPQDITGS